MLDFPASASQTCYDVFGVHPKQEQLDVVRMLAQGRDCILVAGTGWGKTLVCEEGTVGGRVEERGKKRRCARPLHCCMHDGTPYQPKSDLKFLLRKRSGGHHCEGEILSQPD